LELTRNRKSKLYQFWLNESVINRTGVVVEGAPRGLSKEVIADSRLMKLYFEFFYDKLDTFSHCIKTFNFEVNLIMSLIVSMVKTESSNTINYVGTPFFKFMYNEIFSL
jgi:hypothetical protein